MPVPWGQVTSPGGAFIMEKCNSTNHHQHRYTTDLLPRWVIIHRASSTVNQHVRVENKYDFGAIAGCSGRAFMLFGCTGCLIVISLLFRVGAGRVAIWYFNIIIIITAAAAGAESKKSVCGLGYVFKYAPCHPRPVKNIS